MGQKRVTRCTALVTLVSMVVLEIRTTARSRRAPGAEGDDFVARMWTLADGVDIFAFSGELGANGLVARVLSKCWSALEVSPPDVYLDHPAYGAGRSCHHGLHRC